MHPAGSAYGAPRRITRAQPNGHFVGAMTSACGLTPPCAGDVLVPHPPAGGRPRRPAQFRHAYPWSQEFVLLPASRTAEVQCAVLDLSAVQGGRWTAR